MNAWPGEKMKLLRQKYGESQVVFCRRFPVSPSRYAAWEQGQDAPSAMAQTIMGFLEVFAQEGRIQELQNV